MTIAPSEIFKAYDIRGIVGKTLTPAIVEQIGMALGSEAQARQQTSIVIGRDGRLSGLELAAALARGMQSTGVNVIDVGCVATPMTYFAAFETGANSAVMVTGSHNPPDYNGLKMVLGGETLASESIQNLRRRIETQDFAYGNGTYRAHDIAPSYQARIVGDIRLARPLKIIVDAGNGVAGAFAPALYRALGCSIEEMYCEVDGNFPNHHPDPSVPKNLADLIVRLKDSDADVGLAFDGDGDRLGVVTRAGQIIYPDRQLMLYAADMLARNPGATVIYDVKSTRNLDGWIRQHGGVPLLWKTGHSLVKAKMKETGAQLAGEMSGHVFFKERWYGFDDGLYTGARLLEILSKADDIDAVFAALPDSFSTPELNVKMEEGGPHRLIAQLQQGAVFPGASRIVDIDGLRVEYPDGFGLMRASNTTPVIVLRFEADTPETLARIQEAFRHTLLSADPHLQLPF